MSTHNAYYVNCIPGIEHVTAAEVEQKLDGVTVKRIDSGRVLIDYPASAADLLRLRTVEDVCAYAGDLRGIQPGEDGLDQIKAQMALIDLDPALANHAKMHNPPDDPAFRVTATRQGNHSWHSPDAAGSAGAAVVDQRGWRVSLNQPHIDIWVQIEHDNAVVGVRLSTDALAQRSRVAHGIASVKATVAHALCLMSEPQPGEVFLDPMCGAGTILVERASIPEAQDVFLLGSDKYELPIGQAQTNVREFGVHAGLIQTDATKLALVDNSVDKIVSNLPWGRRIGSHRTDRRLYPRFMREFARVLRPGGLAALLTLERRLLLGILERMRHFELLSQTKVKITGMEPSIYILRRTAY